ncbi:MAG: ComEC/Rec2 family competence protein [Chitinispirillaceae bacterium]|nr:ComEC/Rec2 family competence protein [Chitinispirillaceae bacterium]
MHHITTYFKNCHPDLLLWTRFPGLLSFTGSIAGIWISSVIPEPDIILRYSLFFSLIAAALITVAIVSKKKLIRFTLFSLSGMLIFQIKVQSYDMQISNINLFCADHPKISVSGRVVSNPSPTQNYSFTFLIKTDSLNSSDSVLRIGRTFICQGRQAPLYGTAITVQGKVTTPAKKKFPYIFNDFDYLFSNRIHAKVFFDRLVVADRSLSGLTGINAIARNYVLEVISNLKNADYRSVLRAAFIGESKFLSEETKQKFRKSGIYHLLAISGLHAAILTAAAFAFFFLIPLHPNMKRCAVITILWVYQLFIGWQPSLIRATIMASMMIAAFLFEKKQYTLQSLGIAGTVLLLFSPAILFSPGFQLSFAATAGIVILYPRLASFKTDFGPPFIQALFNHLYTSFSISLCGFLFTAPVLIYHFGTVSMFGLISNIVAVLIMTSGMWVFFISLLLQPVLPDIVSALSSVLSFHFDVLFGLANLSAHFPFSDLQLPVPGSAITIAYLIVLVGIATIKKQFLLKFCLFAISFFTLLTSAKLIADTLDKNIHLLQYNDTFSSWSAIRWPGGSVWIINYKLSRTRKSNQDWIVNQWMRQHAGSSLEKVFDARCNLSPVKKQDQLSLCSSDKEIPVKDSIVLECCGHRNSKHQSDSCILYNGRSPQQMKIFRDSVIFRVESPPVKISEKCVLLKTLH